MVVAPDPYKSPVVIGVRVRESERGIADAARTQCLDLNGQ